tara:strand:+ start:376 stop:792 length:417 start_codon:yes stop_codon:yes gene_type:complete
LQAKKIIICVKKSSFLKSHEEKPKKKIDETVKYLLFLITQSDDQIKFFFDLIKFRQNFISVLSLTKLITESTGSNQSLTMTTTATRSPSLVFLIFAALFTFSSFKGVNASAFLATDKNFDSAVLGSNKNVFVKFLAPW